MHVMLDYSLKQGAVETFIVEYKAEQLCGHTECGGRRIEVGNARMLSLCCYGYLWCSVMVMDESIVVEDQERCAHLEVMA